MYAEKENEEMFDSKTASWRIINFWTTIKILTTSLKLINLKKLNVKKYKINIWNKFLVYDKK